MSIIEILNRTNKEIAANIDLLAKDYKSKTGREVCRTCPSDMQLMILTLKNHYKMTQFKFIRHNAMYKNAKGDKTTISNGNLTDEKAIEFLKTKPFRIELFSEYPSNWKDLIEGKNETKKDKEERLAAKAEINAAKAGKLEKETPEEKAKRLAEETVKKPTREELGKLPLKDLREKYPKVKATSIKDFIDKVLAL